jgi:hypothetical protein
MASPLNRVAKLRALRDPEGNLWDSTLLPRIREKMAQATGVAGAQPATVATPSAKPGLGEYSKYIAPGMDFLAENQRLAGPASQALRSLARGSSPKAVATEHAPLIKKEVGDWATATPERAQQVATEHGGGLGRIGAAWSKMDNTVKRHPVLGALALANPLTAIPAAYAGISAYTGAGDKALNAGIRSAVGPEVDRRIQTLPNTQVTP